MKGVEDWREREGRKCFNTQEKANMKKYVYRSSSSSRPQVHPVTSSPVFRLL